MATGQNGIQFTVLTSIAELEAYEAAYRALFDASDASPYHAYEWLHAYLQHHPAPAGVFICIATDHEGPLAVIPMAAQRNLLATHLTGFGDGPANVVTGCYLPRAAGLPLVRMAADWVRRHHIKWDYLAWDRVTADTCLELARDADSDRSRFATTAMAPSMVIDLPATWDDYLASRNRNHRSNIRRCIRNLEASGEVVMKRLGLGAEDDTSAIDQLIEDALTVSRLSWQGSAAHGHAICDADWIGFFRDSSRALARRGMLDLGLLYVDCRPVAFSWGHQRGGKSWIASSGFDQALRDESPGLVLDAMVIKDSIERGMRELDWGHQFPEYKQRWITREFPIYEICLYANRHLSPLKRRVQARWDRSVAPRLAGVQYAPELLVALPAYGV